MSDNQINNQMHEIHPKKQPLRVYILSVVFLAAIAAVTAFVVSVNKRPGQMTMIESQAMDMTVMKAPVGSVPVALETVEAGEFGSSVTYSGSVVPFTEQDVYPRIEGWIDTMYVYPGDSVAKGQLLVRLVSPDVGQRAAAAAAESDAAGDSSASMESEVERMREMVEAAAAGRDAARADAEYRENELARMETLFESGAVSRSEVEQERSMNAEAYGELLKMEADVQAAWNGLKAMEKQRNAMRAMAVAGSSRAAAERFNAGYLELRSNIAGVVTERTAGPGTLARPGAAIMKIAEIGKVRLQANVSQADAARISAGNPVEVTTGRRPGEVFRSRVTTVFPASDTTTRTVVVESVVENEDGRFMPGDFVTMQIGTGGGSDVVSIPDRAIVRWGNNGKPFVWVAAGGAAKGNGKAVYTCVMHPEVIRDKPGKCPKCGMELVPKKTSGNLTAHRATITTGGTNGDRTEITGGLEPGDQVVVDGGEDLNEGDVLFATDWSEDGPEEFPPAPAMEKSRVSGKNGEKRVIHEGH